MKPRVIYQTLCEASNLDAAVAALAAEELSSVAQYLSKLKPTGGVPAQVWGMVSARLGSMAKPERKGCMP